MTSIGYLIPEFPGQTHAFFMRERAELKARGVETVLLSTRPPSDAVKARHEWAREAESATTYLTPFRASAAWQAAATILWAGPRRLLRCIGAVLSSSELTAKQKLRVLCMIPVAAQMIRRLQDSGCRHLHIHSCANSAWLGVFTALLSDMTYSLTLHGPLHDYGPAQAVKWKHAAFVIVITNDLIREARTALPEEDLPPLQLAPMGLDIRKFQRTVDYIDPTENGPIRLVSCGRINPCKGHDDLIRAVGALNRQGVDTSLTICGSRDSQQADYEQLLRRLIRDHGLEGKVELTGSVSEERVRSELENAHFFCLASHKEPLGVATMEAMAMEMPVIVTESPGVSEMITTGHDGVLVPPKNPQAFVDTLRSLAADSAACRRLAVNARLTVEQGYHSGVSAEVIANSVISPKNPVIRTNTSTADRTAFPAAEQTEPIVPTQA